MAPHHTPKKEQIQWFLCENCHGHLLGKDKETHEKCCPIPSNSEPPVYNGFIQNEKLYVSKIGIKPPMEELDDLFKEQLNEMIFITESAIELCGFMLQDYVSISSSHFKDKVPIVRTVWPMSDWSTSTVFATKEEIANTWKGKSDMLIVIEKLPFDPLPAAEVVLNCYDNSKIEKKLWKDLSLKINKKLCHRVYCNGSEISFEFFNKPYRFIIEKIVGKNYTDNLPDLQNRLRDLNLSSQQFYLMGRDTRYVQKSDGFDEYDIEKPMYSMSKIGGMDETIKTIQEAMNIAFGRKPIISGIQVARSILLYGVAGCGKTLLCNGLAAECDANVFKLNASEIFSKYFGETETNLMNYFDKAFSIYPKPSLLIIEELVSVCGKDNKEDSAKRVCSTFLNLLDCLHTKKKASKTFILVTTSNIENINPAARRTGRIDLEIEISAPNPLARAEILSKQLKDVANNLTNDQLKYLANACHGFVGGDLASLIAKAAMHAVNVCQKKGTEPILRFIDIENVFSQVHPSAMREVQIESPNVKWRDIGGQKKLINQLKQSIEWPLNHPETFNRMGVKPPRGILMYGPPGCSKTMIAKALATESKVNFLSIKGPELFSMWVGESERAVRELFRKAREVAPAIIFFDEIDALGGERSNTSVGSSVKERVLAQMLTEMDGITALNNVTIVAATNRPDLIDKALLRPGRIDRLVYVSLPDFETRREIFLIKLEKMPIDSDVNIDLLAQQTENYSGAEIEAVCQEAAMRALEQNIEAQIVQWEHFQHALNFVSPRTSKELINLYQNYTKHTN